MTIHLLGMHHPHSLVAFGTGGERTAQDLLRDAATIARSLPEPPAAARALLCFKSDRYAFAASILAAWAAGFPVALPPNLRAETVTDLLNEPDVAVLLHDTGVSGHLSVPELLQGSPAPPLPTVPEPKGIAAQVLTSGSTGSSEAWEKTLPQLMDEVQAWVETFHLEEGSRFVATVPAAHLYGLLFSVLLPLATGGSFLRQTPLLPEAVADGVHKHQAHVLVTVPVHLRAAEVIDPTSLESLRWVLSSTAPLPEATATSFIERHGLAITEIFGSTETGGIAWRRRGHHERWQPLKGVFVSESPTGQLVVDSPYANGTGEPLVTSDHVEVHDDQTFLSFGRRDNVVKVGGRRVNLQAMEEWLARQPGIADAVVLSIPDSTRGARILAALVAPNWTEVELRKALGALFEPSTLPQRFLFVHRLPREDNGKLQRHRVLRLFGLGPQGEALAEELTFEDVETEGDPTRPSKITASLSIPRDYIHYGGHFDAYPVMAGIVQLHELIIPLIHRYRPGTGELHKLSRVKFTGQIRPGDVVKVDIELNQRSDQTAVECDFSVYLTDRRVSSGRLSFLPTSAFKRLTQKPNPTPQEGTQPEVRCCALIPIYENPQTIRPVVEECRNYLKDIIIINDGSGPLTHQICEKLATEGLATVHHLPKNKGKGAALKAGFSLAKKLGFTHVLQVDADGQHDLSAAPTFLELARQNPETLILGYPDYDDSAPRLRRYARKITDFWVGFEVGWGVVRDAMIGFRIYPLTPLSTLDVRGNRMDFDIEIIVRSAWAGIPIKNAPVGVRYLSREEGGVSHFRPLGDSLQFSWLHTRLGTIRSLSVLLRLGAWPFRALRSAWTSRLLPESKASSPSTTASSEGTG